MKILQLFIALIISYAAQSQTYSPVYTPIKWTKGGFDSLFLPQSDTLTPKDKTKAWITLKDSTLYTWTSTKWKPITGAASIDLSNYIQKQTQNPTATLTGGETRELMSSGADLSYTLSWSAGRAAATSAAQATANISTVNVAGTSETFSNPSAGSTVSGTQAVTVVRNTNTTFTNTVTTADSKTATASTSVIFQPKRYWFYSTSATPASSDVVAALGGGSELSTSIIKSGFTVTISGTNKSVSYASPSNEGHVTSIKTGGNIETFPAFTERTVSVTNASGYTQNYYVLTSNTLYSNTTFTFDSVQ